LDNALHAARAASVRSSLGETPKVTDTVGIIKQIANYFLGKNRPYANPNTIAAAAARLGQERMAEIFKERQNCVKTWNKQSFRDGKYNHIRSGKEMCSDEILKYAGMQPIIESELYNNHYLTSLNVGNRFLITTQAAKNLIRCLETNASLQRLTLPMKTSSSKNVYGMFQLAKKQMFKQRVALAIFIRAFESSLNYECYIWIIILCVSLFCCE
jgi:hypothetical protein